MNISRLKALEVLERGLRVEMRSPFRDGSLRALHHPCGTACCHAGWGAILAYSSGFPDAHLWLACCTTQQYFDLQWDTLTWLCSAASRLADGWTDCSEREGRLRLRILIELQSEDVDLLTAELQRRMSEPVAPATTEVREEVCA